MRLHYGFIFCHFFNVFLKALLHIFRFKTKWLDWTSHPSTRLSHLSISSSILNMVLFSLDSTKPLFPVSNSSNNLNKTATCSNRPPSKGHSRILATRPWPRGSGRFPTPDPLRLRFPAGVTAFPTSLLSPPWLEISGSDLSYFGAFLIDGQVFEVIDGYQCRGLLADWLAWSDNSQLDACY